MNATYRLQLTPELGFSAVRELIPYLQQIGVSHLYLSPIMRARDGSTHGYDVVDPNTISETLGGEAGFRELTASARAAGLGTIVDFVPNHMAVCDENPYWCDPEIRRRVFDIDERTGWQRRFFTIDDLAGVRVEDPEVFEMTHGKILQLVAEGLVDGLRIDHVDGLADPPGYLERLRNRGVTLIWVEKILEGAEQLRDWPVQGTTGYEFANDSTALLTDPRGERALTELYAELTGERRTFAEIAHEAKLQQAHGAFAPELRKLRSLHGDSQLDRAVASLPVYRSYVRPYAHVVEPEDCDVLAGLPESLRRVLLLEQNGHEEFVVRFQQTTGAIMAKGVEDTAFYRYLRLTALNEVGGDPDRFSLTVEQFHRANEVRGRRFPQRMLASQTHDTKRSGDVRARISALSETAPEWVALVRRWREANRQLRSGPGPDPNEEYLIYQTLVGTWPIEHDRLASYLCKAMREAKLNSDWDHPREAWERSVIEFARALYGHRPFRDTFDPFVERIARIGESMSLVALLLRLTSPGVPDIYEGDEVWVLNLVDPDNRRPVDFSRRRLALARLVEGGPVDRSIRKLSVIREALAVRRRHPAAFAGDYAPLPAGPDVCAFTRGAEVAVIVGVNSTADARAVEPPPGDWVELPVDPQGSAPLRLLERV